MKRLLLVLVCVSLFALPAAAQPPAQAGGAATDLVSKTLKTSFDTVSRYLAGSAEKMPEANFAFKPTPEVRSFGEIVGHVANSHFSYCSRLKGEKNPNEGIDLEKKTAKADVVKALADSIAYCSEVYAGMTDAKALEMMAPADSAGWDSAACSASAAVAAPSAPAGERHARPGALRQPGDLSAPQGAGAAVERTPKVAAPGCNFVARASGQCARNARALRSPFALLPPVYLENSSKPRHPPPPRFPGSIGSRFALPRAKMTQGHPVSIAALLAADLPLRPHEAVAIVLELCAQVARGRASAGVMPAISASTVTVDATGAVVMAGGIPGEDEQTVSLVGRLLLEMLDHSAARADSAVPPRLRATAFRAASSGRAAFDSLSEFVSALRRHGPDYGRAEAIGGVFERWADERDGSRQTSLRGDGVPRPLSDRRKNSPPPDVLRRFLREAEQEAFRSGQQVSPPVLGTAAAPAGRKRWVRGMRALIVAAMLLVLAGAGFVFLSARSVDELPFVAPVAKPTPVVPRGEPGWELLRQPERASVAPQPQNVPKAGAAGHGKSVSPPPDVATGR